MNEIKNILYKLRVFCKIIGVINPKVNIPNKNNPKSDLTAVNFIFPDNHAFVNENELRYEFRIRVCMIRIWSTGG